MTRMKGVPVQSVVRLTEDHVRCLVKDIVDFSIHLAQSLPVKGETFYMHGDLHGGNVLIDPETKRLTGVIDFGSMYAR